MDVVSRIHADFLQEAKKSPILLNDLANMEKYIAESYSGRSLIELLQNADDASANRFLIKQINENVFIIANDGREFNEDDLSALCRSGASTKKRKGNTIGYRGIGFKSVVNYASVVHLYSGNVQATFSREETTKVLENADSVPLIRIPHCFFGNKYLNEIDLLLEEGFGTIFIFEIINSCLVEEISAFDSSCMLFLRNVSEIRFETKSERQVFLTGRQDVDKMCEHIIYKGKTEGNEWLVFFNNKEDDVKIAFRYGGKTVINATPQESVIHSFMPTNDKINIPFKINGDFSTDPSRTKVVMDNETEQTMQRCLDMLDVLIQGVLEKNTDEYGIFSILNQAKLDSLRAIRGYSLSDRIVEKMLHNAKKAFENCIKTEDGIYLQPQGVVDGDFEEICKEKNILGIGNKLEIKIPGILDFAKLVGIGVLPLEIVLSAMENKVFSKETRVEIFAKAIERSRIGIDKDILELLHNANIVTFNSGCKKIIECNKEDVVEEGFGGAILDRVEDFSAVERFYKTMGISYEKKQNEQISVYLQDDTPKRMGSTSVIKKWRTVEENVVEALQNTENIVEAIDVSTKNLGYDIEVILKDGTHQYYEVKSVDSMGMAFSMTNNEFSSAVQYKDKYFLAIVQQDDARMEICFVCNPIDSINMTKRVTRWEWYCSSYSGKHVEYRLGG